MRIQLLSIGASCSILMTMSLPASALCTRLPLSDVGFSEPAAIASARTNLKAYAIKELRQRGWKGREKLLSSSEQVTCKPYISLGGINAGYRCRVTATFCTHRPKRHPSAIGRNIKLRLRGSEFEISGILRKFDKTSYVITPPNSGNVTVPSGRFECISAICPKLN